MVKDNNLKEFEEMFDLVLKDDENSQVEEYGHSMNSEEPFDDLVKVVSEDMKKVNDKGTILEVENSHDIMNDILSRNSEEQNNIHKNVEQFDEKNSDDMCVGNKEEDFDCLLVQDIEKENINDVVENINEFHNDIKDKEGKKEISSLDEINIESYSMTEDDKIIWSLKSPSIMYDPFYKQKKVVLDSCLIGGQVKFSQWNKELGEAQVDVVTEVFDQQVIIKQMEEVQQFRNRVKYIGVRVNNQYFLFDRFTPLLRGYLARIQYLKPILKQDGLILEHMGDVEMYFERLRGLHKSVADTEKNLAAAYEMLSRKVTICMELPPVERYLKSDAKSYHSKFINNEDNKSSEMGGFDDLPSGAIAGAIEKKSGAVGWGDI